MIKDLIARGVGFLPGKVQYIVTHGLGIGVAVGPDCYHNIFAPIRDENLCVSAPIRGSHSVQACILDRNLGIEAHMDDLNVHIEAQICED